MTRRYNSQIPQAKRASVRRKGQGIVEFALVVPLLITILIGIMECGWLIKNTLTITNATREGARAASLGKPLNQIQARIQSSVGLLRVTAPNGQITMAYSSSDGSDGFPYVLSDSGTQNNAPVGSFIKVTVITKHSSLTGFFPFLKNREVKAFVTMRREAV